MSLVFAPFGKELTVLKITSDEKTKRHLENLGITVGGRIIAMTSQGGSMILKVKESRLALNRALAMKIQVA